MSIRVITLVFDADMKSAARNGVMIALADGANDDGTHTYKGRGTIAKMANVSVRTVPRICSDFESEGLIIKAGKGPSGTVRYHINLASLKALNPCHSVTPDTVSPLTPDVKTPDTVSPEPSLSVLNNIIIGDFVPEPLRKETKTAKLAEELFTKDELELFLERFISHHTEKKTKSKDFNRQWRTWIQNQVQWRLEKQNGKTKPRNNYTPVAQQKSNARDEGIAAAAALLSEHGYD